ncbi:response regulator [Pseudomonas sp. NPDC089554]|uniref:response regulator n=1 Tax=Pseudomonas sp. NPDC089554 TaxID=3390653 RepID=UPI003CFCFB4E
MNAGTILVVDDDPQIQKLLQNYLGQIGFRVRTATSGSEFRQALSVAGVDLVILDVLLPDDNGFSLCQWMHEHPEFSKVPIIMLTGWIGEANRVRGLELGADAYLCKPFGLRELGAQIKALLRRTSVGQGHSSHVLEFGDWSVDMISRCLTHLDGEEVMLSGGDFALLELFLARPRQVLCRDTIGNAIRGRDLLPLERAIDTAVYRLRQRLRDTEKPLRLIQSVRGKGYLLAVEVTSRRRI